MSACGVSFALFKFLGPKVPVRCHEHCDETEIQKFVCHVRSGEKKRFAFSTRVQDTTEGEDIAGWSAKGGVAA
jgi:hypothetical protein